MGNNTPMSEQSGTKADPNAQLQQIMKALQDQFQAAQQALAPAAQGGGGGSPMITPGTGATPAPQPNIMFNPQGAPGAPIQTAPPPASRQFTPTGSQSIGEYHSRTAATNAGLVSLGNSLGSMISNAEQREQGKKAALAENYLLQINALIASGNPEDRKKAQMLMDDPKIRKALKTGLEYVPLEEEVPPEAKGVQEAMQKITGQSTAGGGRGAMTQPDPGMSGTVRPDRPPGTPGAGMGQPGQPQRRAILPQPGVQQQIQAAFQNALLQKLRDDPASAIPMMGQSQLTAAEQRANEFYKAGLGVSPEQLAKMSLAEKLTGMRVYEGMMKDAMRMEVDLYKANVGYQGKVDTATVLNNGRRYVADQLRASRSEVADKKAAAGGKAKKLDPYAQGAKMYEDMAKKYLDLSKQANISPQDKARYEQMATQYNQKADDYLNQANDQDLMEDFMKAMEEEGGGPDATDSDSTSPN